jgi:hypothetical protein
MSAERHDGSVGFEQVGWMHPAYGRRTVLTDEEKAVLQGRAPTDPTYSTGFIPVFMPEGQAQQMSASGSES